MKQFLLSQLRLVPSRLQYLPTVLHAERAREILRLAARWCSWHPSPEVALTARLVTDLAGNEGVRLWFRLTARVLWTRLSASLERRSRG